MNEHTPLDTIVDRLPLAVYSLTEAGRKALDRYRTQLTAVLESIP